MYKIAFMETSSYQNTLKQVPLFSGLSGIDLERLGRVTIRRRFPKGQAIITDGQALEGFYVVTAGVVKVYKLSEEGKEQILHIITPGGTFAEATVFTDGISPANATAITDCEVFFIFNDDLIRLIKETPQLALNMLASMSRYLRSLVAVIDELALKDVPARLAKYLLDLAINTGVKGKPALELKLPITKKELASRLGTISETLSRALHKLKSKRIIKVSANRITILDKSRMEQIAAGMKF